MAPRDLEKYCPRKRFSSICMFKGKTKFEYSKRIPKLKIKIKILYSNTEQNLVFYEVQTFQFVNLKKL